ncbi:MAG: arylsulfatase [Verrucomicrobia bacterium]|jgi:arylsulfatase A|nr:arylsulfatase [Verrucomicrobiota bacterium]MDA7645043.1 arylsulfatase [bacterium]MDA7667769.1 arylsulfatase [bacterium]MDB4745682.1 arylsulfatase [Verrucomicrobiota bacterium]
MLKTKYSLSTCLIYFLSTTVFGSLFTQAQPNVLILYADDLGFGDLGCYNPSSKIPTPHLDRLASQGIRFTDGHSSSGICTPSRYALLTGRHHWRKFHGIVGPLGGSMFSSERLTLPEMLKDKGYGTACIGKWHLGWDWPAIRKPEVSPILQNGKKAWGPEAFHWAMPIPDGPLAHGFDHYFGDTVINFPPYAWIEDDHLINAPDTMMDESTWKPIKEGGWECRPGPMVTGWNPYDVMPTLTKRGVDYLRSTKGQDAPFFLYFAFPGPHAPIIPNDRFDGTSQAGPYGDFVVEIDDAIGQLLQALEESGHAENTLVLFTADNGPEKYAYARDEKFEHWSAEPLRGLKRDIYEGGHRVPFMIRWPGTVKPGKVSKALVSQIDIMATIAEVTGYSLPNDQAEDSHNLVPLLKGETHTARETHIHNTRKDSYAIRDGDWLLVNDQHGYMSGRNLGWESKHQYPADDAEAHELYRLSSDPGQRNNLASKHPERVKQMRALIKRIREQGHSAPRIEHP